MTLEMHLRLNNGFSDMSFYIFNPTEQDMARIEEAVDSYWTDKGYKNLSKIKETKDPRKKTADFFSPFAYNTKIKYNKPGFMGLRGFRRKVVINQGNQGRDKEVSIDLKLGVNENKEFAKHLIEYLGLEISKEVYDLLYKLPSQG